MENEVNKQYEPLDLRCYSPESLEVYRLIGHGLQAQADEGNNISLSLEGIRDNGDSWLLIRLNIQGERVELYCKEQVWLEFVRPFLPIDKFLNISEELLPALTSVSLSGFTSWAKANEIKIENIENVHAVESPRWEQCDISLKLESPSYPGSNLTCYVYGLAKRAIQALEKIMSPVDAPTELNKLPISCAVGLSMLTVEQLQQLRLGDCVVCKWACNIEDGQLFLFQNKPISIIRMSESRSFIVEQMMNEFDELLDLSDEKAFPGLNDQEKSIDLEQLMIPVVLEVGQIDIAISELATLRIGSILETELKACPQVRLRANGKVIGLGSLVQLDDKLGVKIEQIVD